MNSENMQLLEDMIRDKLADDEVIYDLFEYDEDFERMMELVSNAIGEWLGLLLRRSSEE